jgi:signal peptidase I
MKDSKDSSVTTAELLSSILESLRVEGRTKAVVSANGGSMFPTIVRGDRIHLDFGSPLLKVGTIILARDRLGRHLIHRVVQLEPELITRGDACQTDDPPIESVLACVEKVEKTWCSRLRRIYFRFRASG